VSRPKTSGGLLDGSNGVSGRFSSGGGVGSSGGMNSNSSSSPVATGRAPSRGSPYKRRF
jgi:hypothetical protein